MMHTFHHKLRKPGGSGAEAFFALGTRCGQWPRKWFSPIRVLSRAQPLPPSPHKLPKHTFQHRKNVENLGRRKLAEARRK